MIQEKGDASELVLDGRLIGEQSTEVNLAELLEIARREFNEKDATLDEGLLQAQWPKLRQRLDCAMRHWIDLPSAPPLIAPRSTLHAPTLPSARSVPAFITIRPPAMLPPNLHGQLVVNASTLNPHPQHSASPSGMILWPPSCRRLHRAARSRHGRPWRAPAIACNADVWASL